MKRLTFATLALLLFLIPSLIYAQNSDDLKAMEAYAAPGDIHKMMAKSAGTWTCTVTMWMSPGTQPMNSTTEAKNEMILGGRYLQQTNTGSFMGQPFSGISTTGYDNAKKMFVNTWIDNMGTGIMFLTGNWDAASKTVTLTGNMVDPASGKDISVRETWKIVDDNHQELAMFSTANGQEFKNMEIKMVRKS